MLKNNFDVGSWLTFVCTVRNSVFSGVHSTISRDSHAVKDSSVQKVPIVVISEDESEDVENATVTPPHRGKQTATATRKGKNKAVPAYLDGMPSFSVHLPPTSARLSSHLTIEFECAPFMADFKTDFWHLQFIDGKSEWVRLYIMHHDGRASFKSGWIGFVRENNLKAGDGLTFWVDKPNSRMYVEKM